MWTPSDTRKTTQKNRRDVREKNTWFLYDKEP